MNKKFNIKDYNIYSKKFYKKNKAFKRGLAIFLTSFVSVALVLSIAASAVINSYLGKLDRVDIDHKNIGISSGAEDLYAGKDIVNIALYGIDSRYVDEPSRSDAIMLLTIDRKHTKIKLTSIARDTYVNISGHGMDKMNHAYIFGGPELALNTLNSTFNLNVKDYVTANFWALAKIIDFVGGVDIDVSSAERYDINTNYIPYMNDMGIECDYINGTGMQHLTGGQAVAYARVRHVGGDVARGGRQREVLTAMYEDVKKLNPLQYPALISLILEECSTSLTNNEILSLGTWAVKNMSSLKIDMLGLPDDELDKGGSMIGGVWYYTYDTDAAAKKIENFIFETGEFAPEAETADPKESEE